MSESLSLDPIGVFHAKSCEKYELPRQPLQAGAVGYVELNAHNNFEMALEGIDEFERIWVLFGFHKARVWRPKVLPTRSSKKLGVFATRSPHRPNFLGISCVRLLHKERRKLHIEGADLLDQTPVFDIKPYIPYCDSFPDSKAGWVDELKGIEHEIVWELKALGQRCYLESKGVYFFEEVFRSLQFFSGPNHYNRIKELGTGKYLLAYKAWRFLFAVFPEFKRVAIQSISSGYQLGCLDDISDEAERQLHKSYAELYPQSVFPCEENLLMVE